jgi:hypothetical protein
MGYTNPKTIINNANSVINQEIRNFNQSFNDEFDQINARQAENIQSNLKILESKQKQRELGDQLWYENAGKFRPTGGYAEDTKAFLDNLHNDYYNLLNCDTPECYKQRQQLLQVPQQLSEQRGAYDALKKQYDAAMAIEPGQPGSFNAANDPTTTQLMEYGGYSKKIYNKETGQVEYLLHDENGKPIKNADGKQVNVNGTEFTKNAINGSIGIQTYGDPAGLRKTFQEGILKEVDYDGLVTTIEDNRNQYNKLGYHDYTNANKVAENGVKNSNIDALLKDKKAMRNNYPVMIQGLFDQAKAGDQAAVDALNGLGFLGADKTLGGGDDLDLNTLYGNQAGAGLYDGTPEQKAAAEAYYKYINPSDNLLKQNKILKKQVVSSKTDAQKLAEEKLRVRKLELDQKVNGTKNKGEFDKLVATEFGRVNGNEEEALQMIQGLTNNAVKIGTQKGTVTELIDKGLLNVANDANGNTIVSIVQEDKDGNKTTTASYDLSKPGDIKAMQDQFGIRKGQIQAPKKQSNLDQYQQDKKQDSDAQAIFDKMTDEDFGEEPQVPPKNTQPVDTSQTDKTEVPPGGFANPTNSMQRTYNKAAMLKPGDEEYDSYERDNKGIIKKDKNGAPILKSTTTETTTPPPTNTNTEKPTKVSYGQPKDISDDRVDKVANRILTWERASGNGVNAKPHTDFGFNSGTKPKTQEEAVARFEKEYGKKLVGGLNDEALFQAIDWNFNAGRDSKQMLLFASGLIPGTPAEQRAAINGKGNMTDAELNALYKKNEAEILAYVNGNNITGKKMELYMSPKMVKTYSKADLQKQWGPRMGMSKAEIDKWIADNFETIYNESKALIGS